MLKNLSNLETQVWFQKILKYLLGTYVEADILLEPQ